VAGKAAQEPTDWVPVQGGSGLGGSGPQRPEEPTDPAPPPAPPGGFAEPEEPPTRPDEPPLQPETPLSGTRPDIPMPRQEPPASAIPDLAGVRDEPATDPGPMSDPERRRTLVDAFVAEFVASATWRATLAVLESAFPGLGMASTLARRTDELWQTTETLDEVGQAGLGIPVWRDDSGMAFDFSAHLPDDRPYPRPPVDGYRRMRPRASWPYAGAFVIDTIDPLRYHRAVGGPTAPRDRGGEGSQAPGNGRSVATPPPGEGEDTGVVIVADLASVGPRVLDSAALWLYAGRIVAAALHDPLRLETRVRARRALRALRRVVFVDPDLGLGLCLQVDITRTPRCLLAFNVDRDGTRGPRFVSL
jgi:hypothetical protein